MVHRISSLKVQLSDRFNRYMNVKKAAEAAPLPKVVHEVPKKPKKPKVTLKPKVPKAEPEGVTWFALHQIRETTEGMAELLLKTAASEGVLFRQLDALGTFTIGRYTFVRMRADTLKLPRVLKRLWREDRRSSVVAGPGGYLVTLPDGRTGKVPATTLHTLPPMGQTQQFKGTKIKRWELQFPGK